MKKLFYILGIGLLMASCTEDFKDWADPQSNSEDPASASAAVAAVGTIDFTTITADSVLLFTPTYNAEEGTIATNDVTLYNADKSDSRTVSVDAQGRAKTTELRDALEGLYGPEGSYTVPINVVTVLNKDGQAFRFNSNIEDNVIMAAGMYIVGGDERVAMEFVEPGKYTITVPAGEMRFYFVPFTHLNNFEEGKLGSNEETDGFVFGGKLAQGPDAFIIWLDEDPDYTQYIITVNTNDMTYDVEGVVQADPALWYMVGNCIGSNDWDNGAQSVGTGLIPLLPVPGADLTVNGGTTLAYVGYFPAGGQFKFIKTPGDWGEQMNFTNIENPDMTIVSDLDGDNHNIGINTAGYYKITMNTIEKKVTIEKYTDAVSIFLTITMPGDYQGWDAAGTPMTAMGKRANTETHDWFLDAEYSTDANLKFANGTWDINWGATDFPMGYGTQGGPNIPVAAGSYRVFFNDILGLYYFQPK